MENGCRMDRTPYIERARDVMNTEIEAIAQVRDSLDGAFSAVVELCVKTIQDGHKLVLVGIGKSGHIGHKLAATLSSTGSPAAFLHPVEAMHGDLGMVGKGDLVLALSYSGETDELLAVLPAIKRLEATVVAVTGCPDSRLGQWSDLVLPMTVSREACPFNLAPTSTSTALLALGDALAMVLLQARGFGKHDYAKLHPAGAIGRSISLRVTDIMRTDERFPRVNQTTSVRDTLLAMTQARSGSVAVVDADGLLVGIFTDGDFRRHVTADIEVLSREVGQVCTSNPIVVSDKAMAIEVLKVVENKNIDDIIVVDRAGRPVGLVDIQDLPQFKLM